jgi:protein-disulfide isomerase
MPSRLLWGLLVLLFAAAVLGGCGAPAGADYLPVTAAPAQSRSLTAGLVEETMSVKGDASAPVLMIEYSDYQCPFCSRYVSTVLPEIMAQYVETGKVRYQFRDLPLTAIHPEAQAAAEAARCAGEQGDYWGMHNALFAQQQAWQGAAARPAFVALAQGLGLDAGALEACLDAGRYREIVQQHLAQGQSLGFSGTPSFIIGEQAVIGAQPFEVFQQVIEQELARQQ